MNWKSTESHRLATIKMRPIKYLVSYFSKWKTFVSTQLVQIHLNKFRIFMRMECLTIKMLVFVNVMTIWITFDDLCIEHWLSLMWAFSLNATRHTFQISERAKCMEYFHFVSMYRIVCNSDAIHSAFSCSCCVGETFFDCILFFFLTDGYSFLCVEPEFLFQLNWIGSFVCSMRRRQFKLNTNIPIR